MYNETKSYVEVVPVISDPQAITNKRLPSRRRVALVIETSNEYARGLMRGIHKYMQEWKPWVIDLREQSRDQLDITWLRGWKGDGIIARIQSPKMAYFLQHLGVPVVNVSSANMVPGIPCVETNDTEFSRMAVNHLMEKGFRRFAFCGDRSYSWSRQREKAFTDILEGMGMPCESRFDAAPFGDNHDGMVGRLREWVSAFQPPVGIMASYDTLGHQLLEACRHEEIEIPDEIGVIGVDNDELLCELSTPSLSSIVPNTISIGYTAASILDRLMQGQVLEDDLVLIPPAGLSVRMSTDRITTSDPLVAEAIRFIREHIYDDIHVSDLSGGLHVSRRVLESRFVKAVGHTPHREIIILKTRLIRQLLQETELNLSEIAERSGFQHAEYITVLFKRETGMTPSEYRSHLRNFGSTPS